MHVHTAVAATEERRSNSMILIVCVDDGMGMMFNKRRQSKDALVRTDMLAMVTLNKKLFVTPYTAKQFLQEEKLPDYFSTA